MLTRKRRETSHLTGLATSAARNLASLTHGFILQSQTSMSDTQADLLFTLRPKNAERACTVGDIETKFLRNIIDEVIKQLDGAKQIDFYCLISNHPWFRASAGYVFEEVVYAWLLIAHPTSKGLLCIAHSPEPPNPLQFIPVCEPERVRIFSGTTAFRSADNHKTPCC